MTHLNSSVTVLMPLHNAEQFLKESVDSILHQTFSDWELVVVDDCSSDGTHEIMQSYGDSRIKILRNPRNVGVTASLIRGLQHCNGALVARMDADDVSHPERLATQIEMFRRDQDLVLCGCNAALIDGNGSAIGKMTFETEDARIRFRLLSRNHFAHPGVMFRKEAAAAAGGYDERFRFAQDYDLWHRMSDLGQIANCSEVLLKYRVHEKGISVSRADEQESLAQTIAAQHLVRNGFALSHGETQAFLRCAWSIDQRQTATHVHEDWSSYFTVLRRAFSAFASRNAVARRAVAIMRREARWQFFNLAAQASRFHFTHWSLLMMGLQIDPRALHPQQVLSGAWAKIRADTPGFHSDMHPTAGDTLAGQTDSCVKG